jgi:hypothetical protein
MFEKAKEKLKAEMESKKNNGYVQCIGQFLLEYLDSSRGSAEAILTEGKTIEGSYKAMEVEARNKPRAGNMVMITPDEGYEIIIKYFGIDKPGAAEPKKSIKDLDIADLL